MSRTPSRGVLGALALTSSLALGAGCHFPISTERVYRDKDGALFPKEGAPEPPPLRAAKKNDLVCGVRRFALVEADGTVVEGERLRDKGDIEAGDPRDIGQEFADLLAEAKIWKEVYYPLREEKVDVILEPRVALSLSKNRATNFLKVLPGVLLPWIDGFGFDYDHEVALEVRVRDATRPDRVCDSWRGEHALTAERYPSVLFWLGLHAGLIVLAVFETASTDAIVEPLALKDAAVVSRGAISWLMKEFEPASRACPAHPDVKENTGRFCIICRRNLRYPILDRVDGRPASGERP
jgi:hypothetical protein